MASSVEVWGVNHSAQVLWVVGFEWVILKCSLYQSEEQGLVYYICCWKRGQNCHSELTAFFSMPFRSVSIREAVLIHSGNLMKISPFSLTPLLRAHPETGQTVRRQWVNHWSISTKSFPLDIVFYFPLRLLAAFDCGDLQVSELLQQMLWLKLRSRAAVITTHLILKQHVELASIPHPCFGVIEYNKQLEHLDCMPASSSHSCSSIPFPEVSIIQRRRIAKFELAFLRQITAFSWLSYSSLSHLTGEEIGGRGDRPS